MLSISASLPHLGYCPKIICRRLQLFLIWMTTLYSWMERWANISNGKCARQIFGIWTRLQPQLETNTEQMTLLTRWQIIASSSILPPQFPVLDFYKALVFFSDRPILCILPCQLSQANTNSMIFTVKTWNSTDPSQFLWIRCPRLLRLGRHMYSRPWTPPTWTIQKRLSLINSFLSSEMRRFNRGATCWS